MPCALALFGASLAAAETGAYKVEGQVFDREGSPLAGIEVTVLERGSGSPLDALRRDLDDRVVIRKKTDAHGLFRVDLNIPKTSGRVVVRCYDREAWDHLRYEPPRDVDVTNDLRRRGHAVVSCAIEDAPAWSELVHQIERAGGAGTPRGKILRAHGIPKEVIATAGGTVEWKYPLVSYVFEQGTLVRTIERSGREDAADQAAR